MRHDVISVIGVVKSTKLEIIDISHAICNI